MIEGEKERGWFRKLYPALIAFVGGAELQQLVRGVVHEYHLEPKLS